MKYKESTKATKAKKSSLSVWDNSKISPKRKSKKLLKEEKPKRNHSAKSKIAAKWRWTIITVSETISGQTTMLSTRMFQSTWCLTNQALLFPSWASRSFNCILRISWDRLMASSSRPTTRRFQRRSRRNSLHWLIWVSLGHSTHRIINKRDMMNYQNTLRDEYINSIIWFVHMTRTETYKICFTVNKDAPKPKKEKEKNYG